MLSEISQSQRDWYYMLSLYKTSRVVKFRKTESRMVVPGAQGGENGYAVSVWEDEKHPGNRWWWGLHIMNVLSATKFSPVAQSYPTLCNPVNHSRPGLPVHHQLPEYTQTYVHQVSDAISHLILCRPLLLLPPIPPSISLFKWVNSLHEVAKVLEFQL